MKPSDFELLFKNRVDRCRKVLLAKNEEYSRGGERLHNFYSAAGLTGDTPERALWGMATKHIVSVQDAVNDTLHGNCPTTEQVDEKITDLINYCVLLEGLFQDRRFGDKEEKEASPEGLVAASDTPVSKSLRNRIKGYRE